MMGPSSAARRLSTARMEIGGLAGVRKESCLRSEQYCWSPPHPLGLARLRRWRLVMSSGLRNPRCRLLRNPRYRLLRGERSNRLFFRDREDRELPLEILFKSVRCHLLYRNQITDQERPTLSSALLVNRESRSAFPTQYVTIR